MHSLMQQAQAMQKQLQRAQKDLESKEFDGSAGGGTVAVRVNGKYEVVEVRISEELLNVEEKDSLESLIAFAINEAIKKVKQNSESVIGGITGGINIPGLM